jgi:hypothetical protein
LGRSFFRRGVLLRSRVLLDSRFRIKALDEGLGYRRRASLPYYRCACRAGAALVRQRRGATTPAPASVFVSLSAWLTECFYAAGAGSLFSSKIEQAAEKMPRMREEIE